MKTLLAILLSFIMTEAPVLAIHGGYSLGGAGNVVGTYAGVMVPTQDVIIATGSNATDFGANALGLFTLSLPTTGLGTGTVYLYSGGQQLTGPVSCLPDPSNTNGIVGVIAASGSAVQEQVADIFGTATLSTITATASGGFDATISASTTSQSPTGINLGGTASITIDTTGTTGLLTPTEQISFEVIGFQQSSSTQ